MKRTLMLLLGMLIVICMPTIGKSDNLVGTSQGTPSSSNSSNASNKISTNNDATNNGSIDIDAIIGELGSLPLKGKDSNVSVLNLDLSIPESPAFTILGLTPQSIVRPTTLRDLVTTLLNGIDQNGNFQTGIAIDVAPYRLGQAQNARMDIRSLVPQLLQVIKDLAKTDPNFKSISNLIDAMPLSLQSDFLKRELNGLSPNQRQELQNSLQNKLQHPDSNTPAVKRYGITIRDYQKDWGKQFLMRTKISFGTAKGTSDSDKAVRMGLGFHFTLFDNGDPVLDKTLMGDPRTGTVGLLETAWRNLGPVNPVPPPAARLLELEPPLTKDKVERYHTILVQYRANADPFLTDKDRKDLGNVPPLPENLTEDQQQLKSVQQTLESYQDRIDAKLAEVDKQVLTARQQQYAKEITKVFDEAKDRDWNASSLLFGLATSVISTSGTFDNLRGSASGFWSTWAIKTGKNGQLLFHARHLIDEIVTDPDNKGMFLKQHDTIFGSRYRFGTPSLGFSIEAAYYNTTPSGRSVENYYRLSLGSEFKITKDHWLVFSIGGEGGRKHGKNDAFVMANFKWGFNSVPTVR